MFDSAGAVVATARVEQAQHFPRPGWVEHDPIELWTAADTVVREAMASAGIVPGQVVAAGLTNQRETVVVWDRETGKPVTRAIVWQDTRTDALCARLGADGGGIDRYRERTGLPLATYFSGPKIAWVLDEVEGARDAAKQGRLLAGTVDSWLLWNLTGGPDGGQHRTDVTNASRTLLMNLDTLAWDPDICADMSVPVAMLPEIRPSSGNLGRGAAGGPLPGVLLGSALGDQQAALFGQVCFEPGEVKNTYGTGSFVLLNTGPEPVRSAHGLITTVGYQLEGERPVYALEGSIAVTGALVQWLRDQLGVLSSADEIEGLAAGVADTGDVFVVPAFSGLFAPHWRPDARGVVVGLTRFTTKGHLARAALEATAFQTCDVLDAMAADFGRAPAELRVDGGMTVNDLLLQIQADLLGLPVIRPRITETTALGAAYAAGLAAGFWPDLATVRAQWRADRTFAPAATDADRAGRRARWREAVSRSLNWSSPA